MLRPCDGSGSAESDEEQRRRRRRRKRKGEEEKEAAAEGPGGNERRREPSRNARIPILIQQPAKVIICRLSATDSSFRQSIPA